MQWRHRCQLFKLIDYRSRQSDRRCEGQSAMDHAMTNCNQIVTGKVAIDPIQRIKQQFFSVAVRDLAMLIIENSPVGLLDRQARLGVVLVQTPPAEQSRLSI
jgi:hypothetical protein